MGSHDERGTLSPCDPLPNTMAKVTFTNGIVSLRGAIDSVKEGQMNRRRLVVRRHDYGEERNYDKDGRKIYELYYYTFHEGAWSEGATRNREIIKAAQRGAHAIERDPELRPLWENAYAEYRATIPASSTKYYHFYNFVYVTILRDMYERAKAG